MNKVGKITKDFTVGKENDYMALINQFTRKQLTSDDVYIFPVTLCNNDIDRDTEQFSLESLNILSKMFIGKTGILDHNPTSNNQVSRIFQTSVDEVQGKLNKVGEPYYNLNAMAYIIKNDKNEDLISEIDGGIKKEVSVGCAISKYICSICGEEYYTSEKCNHYSGREYNGKKCYVKLVEPTDAYEFSFVAVPAQPEAGVTKAYDNIQKLKGENQTMELKYNAKLLSLGIDETKFKSFKTPQEVIDEICKSEINQNTDEFISKAKAAEVIGEEKTADEILNLAKCSKQNEDKAKDLETKSAKYDEVLNSTIQKALENAKRANGDSYDETITKKMLGSLNYDEIVKMSDKWFNEAENTLKGGYRGSEPTQFTPVYGEEYKFTI